jgi:hypothetical protein
MTFLCEQEGGGAAGRPKLAVRRCEQHAPNASTREVGIDEQQVQLSVIGLHGREADDSTALVDGNEQRARRRMVGDELVPVLGREHRTLGRRTEERPAVAHGGIEHVADRAGVLRRSPAHGHSFRHDTGLPEQLRVIARSDLIAVKGLKRSSADRRTAHLRLLGCRITQVGPRDAREVIVPHASRGSLHVALLASAGPPRGGGELSFRPANSKSRSDAPARRL